MLEISNNSSSIMRSCQMKYKWYYIDGLKPVKKSSSLSLGSLLHQSFEMFYNGFNIIDVVKYIADTMDEEIAKASPTEIEDLTISKYTLVGMWVHSPFKLDGFSKIEPEKEFRIPIPGMRGVLYVGKIDGLVTDLKGKLWIRELKSTSLPFHMFEAKSRYSAQTTGYVWAMRQLGIPVVGIIYDYIKKPLLRKNVREDMHQFGNRIIKDYQTRPDIYYRRHQSYRTNDDLGLFENDLRSVARDIRNRAKDRRWHRNTDQCWNYNQQCQYYPICFQQQPDALSLQLLYEQKDTQNKGAGNGTKERSDEPTADGQNE